MKKGKGKGEEGKTEEARAKYKRCGREELTTRAGKVLLRARGCAGGREERKTLHNGTHEEKEEIQRWREREREREQTQKETHTDRNRVSGERVCACEKEREVCV